MQSSEKSKDPLHGITLEMMLKDVVELHGYEELAFMTRIRTFEKKEKPTLKPILKFLRKTPWAREKIENIYVRDLKKITAMKAEKASSQ